MDFINVKYTHIDSSYYNEEAFFKVHWILELVQ